MSLPSAENWSRSALIGMALAAGVVAGRGAAEAQTLYFGLAGAAERLGVTFDKTVDNTDPNTLAPPPWAGIAHNEVDTASGWGSESGAVAGVRIPIGLGFVRIEADYASHSDGVGGKLEGIGESPGRNELGELWPDTWEVRRERSLGLTLHLGGSPGALDYHDASVYVLGGIRRASTTVVSGFEGCLSPVPCNGVGLVSGTTTEEITLLGWTAGAGLEKAVFGRVAVGAEARYTRYPDESWTVPFTDVAITVPTVVHANGLSLHLRLLVFF